MVYGGELGWDQPQRIDWLGGRVEFTSEQLTKAGLEYHRGTTQPRCPYCNTPMAASESPRLGKVAVPVDFVCEQCKLHGRFDPEDAVVPWTEKQQVALLRAFWGNVPARCPHDDGLVRMVKDPSLGSRHVQGLCGICGTSFFRELQPKWTRPRWYTKAWLWLKDNRDQFGTLLSMVGIVVATVLGVVSLRTTYQLIRITDYQRRLEEASHLPSFEVTFRNASGASPAHDTDSLMIDNTGARVTHMDVRVYAFLVLDDGSPSRRSMPLLVPVSGWLGSLVASHPHAAFSLGWLERSSLETAIRTGSPPGLYNGSLSEGLVTLAHISYETDLRERRDEYFLNSDRGDRRLAEEDAEAVIASHDQMRRDGLAVDATAASFNSVTALAGRVRKEGRGRPRLANSVWRWIEAQQEWGVAGDTISVNVRIGS